jgi:hypothetical protein
VNPMIALTAVVPYGAWQLFDCRGPVDPENEMYGPVYRSR